MTWYVTLSYSAAQAPMKRCAGTFLVAFAEVCGYGFDPTGQVTTDQFGNAGVALFGRMLGPRYPHRWASGTCDDYRGFWQDYEAGNKRRVRIKGDVGPLGTPDISQFVADDPDDRDLVYGEGTSPMPNPNPNHHPNHHPSPSPQPNSALTRPRLWRR